MRTCKTFDVYIYHHPVERECLVVEEVKWKRQTIKTVKSRFAPKEKTVVLLDGKKIEPKEYKKTRVKVDSKVEILPDVGFFWAALAWVGSAVWTAIPTIALSLGLAYLGGVLFAPDIPEISRDDRAESQNWSWSPRTTQREGGVRPRSYGRNQHVGNIVARWTDVDENGDELLYMILCYGEGPVEGRVSGQTFINGQPVGNFDGLSLQDRRGTFNQSCMTGFEKLKLEYTPKNEVTNDGGAYTFTTPNNFIDDIEYTLGFDRGIWHYDKMGDKQTHSVGVKVQISERGAGSWTTLMNTTVNANQMSPIYRAYKASEQGYDCAHDKQYDLRLEKTTEDKGKSRYGDDVCLRSVREVVDTAFTRPGKVLLGITALATEKLSGSLKVTSEWDDRVVNTYDGANWGIEHSRNRAWVYLDEVTQPVISGDGESGTPYVIESYEGIDPSKIDLALIYEWAEWCADAVDDGKGGTEERMTCDFMIDYQTDLWSVSYETAQVGRMYPYWLGNQLTGWIDKPVTTPIDLVTFDNMVTKSWKNGWTTGEELIGTVNVYYRDALYNYARRPVPISNENAGNYKRTTSLEGIGVTSRSLATRVGNHELKRNELIKNINMFRMYKDAVRYTLGDTIRLQSDVANWAKAYRVVQKIDNNIVELNRTVDASAGDVLLLRSYDSGAEDVDTSSYMIDSVNGTQVTITGTWSIDPEKNFIVAVGATKTRRIIKIEQTPDNYFDVTVETYDSDLFDSDDTQPTNPNPDYVPPAVDNVSERPLTRWEVVDLIESMTPSSPDVEIPWLANVGFTGNAVNTVYWAPNSDSAETAPCLLRYRGVTYEITADETTDEFIYWDPDFVDQFRTTNVASEALAPGNWLFCINKDGVAYPANATQLQHAAILLAGTIRAEQYMELRQTYVYNGDDSLDSSKPFEMPFKIVSEMTAIHSVKLSFRLLPYRAYSTGAASGGGSTPTSSDGGSGAWDTTGPANWTLGASTQGPSTANTSSEDPGDTGWEDPVHHHEMPSHDHTVSGTTESEDCGGGSHSHGLSSYNVDTNSVDPGNTYNENINHQHTMPSHNHTLSAHTHALDGSGSDHTHELSLPDHNHTVTIAAHTHTITYGIHEESNSPTVNFHVNNGAGFGAQIGSYNSDQLDIDITAHVSGTGWKALRFDTDLRCRVFAILECKIDVTA